MSESSFQPTFPFAAARRSPGSLALLASPLLALVVFGLCRLDVAALLAAREPSATLLRAAEASGSDTPNAATRELVARLCDGRLSGEQARAVIVALWPPRVTPSLVADVGDEMSVNACLIVPALDALRDDGPTLGWRLVSVCVDDAPPIVFDAPPTLSRLAAQAQETRWDPLRLPPTCGPGLVRLWCEYEYELHDRAGGTTRWREHFPRTILLVEDDDKPVVR